MKLIDRISLKTAIKSVSVTVGICATVIVGTVVMTNLSFPKDGQGGHDSQSAYVADKEFSGNAVSREPDKVEKELAAKPSEGFVEIPVEEEIGKNQEKIAGNDKNFAAAVEKSVEASSKKALENQENSTDKSLSYFSYRVQAGDTVSALAVEFDVSSDAILSLNHINNARGLQPGQFLKIPNMAGLLYETKKGDTAASVAKKYNIDVADIALVNNVPLDFEFEPGTTIFLPNAKMDWATRQEINGDLFKKPIKVKYYQSSSFGWRSNPFTGVRSHHTGVDMACPHGTSVFAALPGKVSSTGFSSTYGNYVIIEHHSGYKTLYAHMSAILCKKGDFVDQNTKIGRVGSTGLSTGPHLHFTVYKNNRLINPTTLWN